MENLRIKNIYVASCVLFMAAAVVLYVRHPRPVPESEGLQHLLPENLGDWRKIEDITFEDRIKSILNTDDVLGRIYRDSANRNIEIIVVSAVNNRAAFHPPEYCLTGSGNEIIVKDIQSCQWSSAASLTVNEMVIASDDSKKLLVWNWYTAGNLMTHNFYRQQWRIVTDEVRKGCGKGAVINLYTDIAGNDTTEAKQAMSDFVASLLPVLDGKL
jgi:EpsI family protein